MLKANFSSIVLAAMICFANWSTHAETPEEWITLGARVHGAFGSFLPVGIRIGLDALQRLKAEPRGVTVVYYAGPKAPCPCPADGIAIATMASAGQGTLQVAAEKAPEDAFGVAVIRNKTDGSSVKYTVAASWIPKLIDMNKTLDPMGRYQAVMNADDLFSVELLPASK